MCGMDYKHAHSGFRSLQASIRSCIDHVLDAGEMIDRTQRNVLSPIQITAPDLAGMRVTLLA